MRKAILLTAFDRPDYLDDVLDTWDNVRGQEGWDFIVSLEPHEEHTSYQLDLLDTFEIHNSWGGFHTLVNDTRLGVLEHPYKAIQDLMEDDYDFVVRAEDDLLVSEDILEYFSWAAETYREDDEILTVLGFTQENGNPTQVKRDVVFNPWVWGTWSERWLAEIGPSWDHDYSTYNGSPGNQSGWDWNLNTRIMPQKGYRSILPLASRVQNIGAYGVHGTPDNLVQTTSFEVYREPCRYREISISR